MTPSPVKISKFLALILRHKPDAAKLILDGNGWAPVEQVLRALTERFGPFSLGQLEDLVARNDKRRYVLSEDRRRIRAAQGHSVAVDLELQAVPPPTFLFHGTSAAALHSIMREGLVKGRRHHVHLSQDAATALKVGSRRAGPPIVLQIDSGGMTENSFYRSANGVWLTDHVPPRYITVLEHHA